MGLLGAVMAGVAADALLARVPPGDDEGEAEAADTPEPGPAEGIESAEGDLLDDPDAPPDAEAGQDRPGLVLDGTDNSDLISGNGADDLVRGASGDDQLDGRDGADTLDGQTGDDILYGARGDDLLVGGAGNDTALGGDGDDTAQGGDGDDSLAGQEGDDRLTGDEGADTLVGGAGNDTLAGDAGDDWLAGGFGDDILTGAAGADTLDGNDGNDTIRGQDGWSDFLNGGAGDDALHLGAGDHGSGGTGADKFSLDAPQPSGALATIGDYVPGEDEIVVLYDAAAHPAPAITVVTQPGSADATLFLDGLPLARVTGGAGMDPALVRLVAEALAA